MNERVENWLFKAFWIDPKALALVRMLFSGYFLLFLGKRLDWLAAYPESAFHPSPGLASWLPGFPPEWITVALSLASFASTFMVFFGYRTKIASRVMALCLFAFFVLVQGFGKNDHAMLLAALPLLMSFSGWGQVWSMDATRRSGPPKVEAWPMAFLALLIGFLWMTAGLFKVFGGWLQADSAAVQMNVLVYGIVSGETMPLDGTLFQDLPGWLLETMDWAVVLFEMLALPLAFFPKAFRIWIFAAITLHLGIFLFMDFDFTTFILCYTPLFAWNSVRWRPAVEKSLFERIPKWLFFALLFTMTALYWPFGAPYQALKLLTNADLDFWLGLCSISTLWLICGALGGVGLLRNQ